MVEYLRLPFPGLSFISDILPLILLHTQCAAAVPTLFRKPPHTLSVSAGGDALEESLQKTAVGIGRSKMNYKWHAHKCKWGSVPKYVDVIHERRKACGREGAGGGCKPDDKDDIIDSTKQEELMFGISVRISRTAVRKLALAVAARLKDARVSSAYGNGILAPLLPSMAFLSLSRGRPIAPEHSAWRTLEAHAGDWLPRCPAGRSLCSCGGIVCKRGRVYAVFLSSVKKRMALVRDLSPLTRFKRLEVLTISASPLYCPRVLPAAGSFSQLLTFRAIFAATDHCHSRYGARVLLQAFARAAPKLKWLHIEFDIDVDAKSSFSSPPADLEPICELRSLKYLAVSGPFTGLPDCFGELRELLWLDVRGNWFNRPLPPSMKRLTKLVNFIAFGQRLRQCLGPRDRGCTPSWDSRVGAGNHNFKCPTEGWAVPFASAAFPEWANIQRYWVDQNFLSGPIPTWIPTLWPRLRSMDVYSNQLTGSIPAALVAMSGIRQLQLQDNSFEGIVPSVGLMSHTLVFLDVTMSSELRGCWPVHDGSEGRFLRAVGRGRAVLLSARTGVLRRSDCSRERRKKSREVPTTLLSMEARPLTGPFSSVAVVDSDANAALVGTST